MGLGCEELLKRQGQVVVKVGKFAIIIRTASASDQSRRQCQGQSACFRTIRTFPDDQEQLAADLAVSHLRELWGGEAQEALSARPAPLSVLSVVSGGAEEADENQLPVGNEDDETSLEDILLDLEDTLIGQHENQLGAEQGNIDRHQPPRPARPVNS